MSNIINKKKIYVYIYIHNYIAFLIGVNQSMNITLPIVVEP